MYNILPYNWVNTTVASTLCKLFNGKLCDLMMALVADEDPTIDYTERYDVYMSNLPAEATHPYPEIRFENVSKKTWRNT